jgi:hypothetical protein
MLSGGFKFVWASSTTEYPLSARNALSLLPAAAEPIPACRLVACGYGSHAACGVKHIKC